MFAAVTACGTVALGVGFASPASAFNDHDGRYNAANNASNAACASNYPNMSLTGNAASNGTVDSNQGFC